MFSGLVSEHAFLMQNHKDVPVVDSKDYPACVVVKHTIHVTKHTD